MLLCFLSLWLMKNHFVNWADEKTVAAHNQTLFEFSEILNKKDTSKGFGITDKSIEDDYSVFRFVSAEAFAVALSQPTEAVASGEFDVRDAVSKARLLILQPPLKIMKSYMRRLRVQLVQNQPKITDIVESGFFNFGDSWFDSPPEEFVIDLSPFATIVSTDLLITLVYLYGRDRSFHEEYASTNGREYSWKIVLIDGRSSKIKQTLVSCLSRAFAGLDHDLRLRTAVSTIENGMIDDFSIYQLISC